MSKKKIIRVLWKRIKGRTTIIYQFSDGTSIVKEG
jgi:hypothetical protein